MKTVLVVEDDPTMRELLSIHLSTAGYAVLTAVDGLDAWHSIRMVMPDLVIADVNMPKVDGFKFVAALRTRPELKEIPVIFLTIEDDAAERGAGLGAVEYLHKPILLETLLRKVAKHLPAGG